MQDSSNFTIPLAADGSSSMLCYREALMTRMLLKFVIITFVVGALPLPADAQITINGAPPRRRPDEPPKPKRIHGVVQDLRGSPLAGARVFVRDMKKNTTRTVTTDVQGLYSVTGLPPDVDYQVHAEYKGQASEKKLISVFLTREDNVLNFQLDVAVIESAADAPKTGPQLQTFDHVQLQASFDLPVGAPAPIPAVLLLHGFGEDRSVWDPFKKQLLERGWAVMSLDLRGHGASKTRNQLPLAADAQWRTSPHEFPLDLDPALDWLKAQPRLDGRKIVIIGYDVGANLALIASGRFPEVRTVVAVKPSLSESLAMAGSAQDFQPRSALIVASDSAEVEKFKAQGGKAIEVRTPALPVGARQSFQDKQVAEWVFQWLKAAY